MMNIVEMITAEMNKAIAENRITAVEYMKLAKRLRANENDAKSIVSSYIQELTELGMSIFAMEEMSEFEYRYTSQLMDMINFLKDITDKETIINKDTIDKLNEQLCTAVAKGDFVTATKITELINNLQSTIEVVDEEDYDYEDEYGDSTIDIVVRMHRLDIVCELLDMENPIKDKGEMLISEMPMTLLYKITKLRNAISDKIAYETKHSDYYGMFDYCDYYIETEIDLNTVLAIADELIRKTAKE